jgi:hypothetical protein
VYWSAFDGRDSMTINAHSVEYLDLFAIVRNPISMAMPPITSNSPIGNAIEADKPAKCENRCSVAAIFESFGRPSECYHTFPAFSLASNANNLCLPPFPDSLI